MPQKQNSENFEIAKRESLKGDYSIYKPDPVLLMRDNMKLTQMRFFEAYLSKIDASDPETYKVRIPLDTVAELANVDLSNRNEVRKMCEDIESSRFDFKRYRERYEPETIDPKIKDHIDRFPLFDRFRLRETIDGEYFIEVIPGVTMSEMLQKYQKNYATYELQEVYALSNKTNMRMYSCFKRFQKFGTTKISIELLKGYLGIDENKYPKTTILRRDVLEPGVKEINEETDVFVTYKPYRKGRTIAGWSFTIKAKTPIEDTAPKNQMTLDDFIEVEPVAESEAPDLQVEEETEDFTTNPNEINFTSEKDKLSYIENYLNSVCVTNLEKLMFKLIPIEVHEYEYPRVRALTDILIENILIDQEEYLKIDENDVLGSIKRAHELVDEERESRASAAIRKFNTQEFDIRKKGIKEPEKTYFYYKKALEGWLKYTEI